LGGTSIGGTQRIGGKGRWDDKNGLIDRGTQAGAYAAKKEKKGKFKETHMLDRCKHVRGGSWTVVLGEEEWRKTGQPW